MHECPSPAVTCETFPLVVTARGVASFPVASACPICPYRFRPKHIRPVPTTAHECSAPAVTDEASPPNEDVRPGVATDGDVDPVPNCPCWFLPQHHTSCVVLVAHTKPEPISMEATSNDEGILLTVVGV